MRCRICGQEIDADGSYCKFCGAKVYDKGKKDSSCLENGEFAIKDDGTIVRNPNGRRDGQREGMDKEIFEVIEVGACSHRFLASFQARMQAYRICKNRYGKNYRDYVEMLMRNNYPVEYEKAEIVKKYLMFVCVSFVLLMLILPLLVVFPLILIEVVIYKEGLYLTIVLSLIYVLFVLLCYFVVRYVVRHMVSLKKNYKTLCGEKD